MLRHFSRIANYLVFGMSALLIKVDICLAQIDGSYVQGYDYREVDSTGHLYKIITGGFGSFIMVMMGLGGVATILITRQGKAGKNVPILGIVMLGIAIFVFCLRIAIQGGMMGHEYIEWGQ